MISFQDTVGRLNISPDYHFKPIAEARAFDVLAKLEKLVEGGLLKVENLQGRVLDIGAGHGGSYMALRQYSEDVTAVESDRGIADLLLKHKVVPRDKMTVSTPADLITHQNGRQYDLIAVLHLYGMAYDVPVEQVHRRLVQLLAPGGQLLYSAQEDHLMTSFMKRDYERLFGGLPKMPGTSSQVVKNYQIGPDNLLFILTKNPATH